MIATTMIQSETPHSILLPRHLSTLGRMATIIRASARATVGDAEHAVLLEFSGAFGSGDSSQGLVTVGGPLIPTVSGEIVRCHINFDDLNTFGPPLVDLLRSELEPFIIGAGWVSLRCIDKD